MKGHDILQSLNGADEKYFAEYENFETKRKIKVSRTMKISAAIAAAVALLTVPAGAYVYELTHKAEVKYYLEGDSADYIEQKGLALNYVSENEHIRLTVDALLFDGHIGEMIMTVEALDELGMGRIENAGFPEIYLTDPETGEYIQWREPGDNNVFGSDIARGGCINFDTFTDNRYTVYTQIMLNGIDTEKNYLLNFGLDTNMEDGYEYDENGVLVDNLMEGISFETSFQPNVESAELRGENGEQVWLSQIGVFSEDDDFVEKCYYSENSPALLRNGGLFGIEDRIDSSLTEAIDTMYCGWFDRIVDVGDYAGIELNGEKYLKTE